jgi:hypothetical protein
MTAIRAGALFGLILLISGCAAHRLTKASEQISRDVAGFQGQLSTVQDALRRQQQDKQLSISDSADRRHAADAITRQKQVEWAVDAATNGNEVFAPLQAQGREAVATLMTPAPAPDQPPDVSFPIDKLSGVAKALERLSSDRGTRADLQSLVNYGIEVSKQLQKIQDQDKSTAGSAPPPASPGQ